MTEHLPQPDIIGTHGRAWRFDLDAIRRQRPGSVDAGLVSWLIEAKQAHPAWHSYALHLFHLRPLAGFGAPHIYLPGATHEFGLVALHPDKPRSLTSPPAELSPVNFAAQLTATDDGAIARIADTVQEICNGQLSPDTDHLQSWIMRFGSRMVLGDPTTAGETKIIFSAPGEEPTKIVHPPAPPKPPHS